MWWLFGLHGSLCAAIFGAFAHSRPLYLLRQITIARPVIAAHEVVQSASSTALISRESLDLYRKALVAVQRVHRDASAQGTHQTSRLDIILYKMKVLVAL